jgi:hypothetical protein
MLAGAILNTYPRGVHARVDVERRAGTRSRWRRDDLAAGTDIKAAKEARSA